MALVRVGGALALLAFVLLSIVNQVLVRLWMRRTARLLVGCCSLGLGVGLGWWREVSVFGFAWVSDPVYAAVAV